MTRILEFSAQLAQGDFKLDVSFKTKARVLGVFGPSGHGKTTILKVLAGLTNPDQGFVKPARTFWIGGCRQDSRGE